MYIFVCNFKISNAHTSSSSGEDNEVAHEGSRDQHTDVGVRIVAVVVQRHTCTCQSLKNETQRF